VEAVNQIPVGKVKSKRGFNKLLGKLVMRRMLDLLPMERTIQVPRRSADRALTPSATEQWTVTPIEVPVVANGLSETLPTCSEESLVDLQDVCAACCQTEAERRCLQMRVAGHTFQEIADALGGLFDDTGAYALFCRLTRRIQRKWTGQTQASTDENEIRRQLEQEVLCLHTDGYTDEQISDLLGVTLTVVKQIRRDARHKFQKEQRQAAMQECYHLHVRGYNQQEISRALKIPDATIGNWLRKHSSTNKAPQ
jgi:DNA-binding CsgD family transcriptional regulator